MSIFANSPNGTAYFMYALDETPQLAVTNTPAPGQIRDTIYESPAFFSTNKTFARRLIVSNAGIWSLTDIPLNEARVDEVEFVSPAGVQWVLGLGDDEHLYTELFTDTAHKNRRVVTTIMHKGKHVWVADNRFPVPLPR